MVQISDSVNRRNTGEAASRNHEKSSKPHLWAEFLEFQKQAKPARIEAQIKHKARIKKRNEKTAKLVKCIGGIISLLTTSLLLTVYQIT